MVTPLPSPVPEPQSARPGTAVAVMPVAQRVGRMLGPRAVGWLLRFADVTGIFLLLWVTTVAKVGELPGPLLQSRRAWVLALVWLACQWLFDTYRVDPGQPLQRQSLRVLAAAVVAGVIISVAFYAVGPELLDRQYGVFGRWVLSATLVGAALWGVLTRRLLAHHQRGRAGRVRWLVIGRSDAEGLPSFWRDFTSQLGNGQAVLLTEGGARLGDGPQPDGAWDGLERRLGEAWTGVVVTDAASLPEDVVRALMHARLGGMPVLGIEEYCERWWGRVPVSYLRGEWFTFSRGFELVHSPLRAQLKRASDILLALGLLVVAALPMIGIALAVRLSSHGPVLFTQPRVGQGGVPFTCLKFRTMVVGSETGSKYTTTGDRRVTRLGQALRKTRLDELPQLFNVLHGDMSFIGPRAEWTKCVEDYEHVIPFYHLRHLVRPGLTGWAQVNYPYGASIDDARVKLEYDLYYLRHHSLVLDALIVLRTVKVVLFGIGAR